MLTYFSCKKHTALAILKISGENNGRAKCSSRIAAIIAEALVRDNLDFKIHSIKVDSQAPCKRTQHCSPSTPSVCTPCCMLIDVVTCRCAMFETGQTFQPTTPNISFVPWSPKRSATMLDPFAQLFQHYSGARASITHGLQRLMGCILPTMHCRSRHCWDCVASVCTPLPTRRQQLPTLLRQQCWELLRPFARSLKVATIFWRLIFRIHLTLF